MKPYFKKLGLYLLVLLASIWAGILANIILNIPIKLIFEPSNFALNIISLVLDMICMCVTIYLICKKEGYERQQFDTRQIVFAIISLLIIHQIVSLFLKAIYIVGPAYTLSQIIYFKEETVTEFWHIPLWLVHTLTAIIDIVFVAPAIILGEYMGVEKYKIKHKKSAKPSV